jgi:uncharacterized protein (DUF58 family)
MIAPSTRLIWMVALVITPAAALAGLLQGAALPASLLVGIVIAFAAADAVSGLRRLDAVHAAAPASLRLTKDVTAAVPLVFENRTRQSLPTRVAIVPPEGVSCEKLTETVTLPPGRSELAWPCTGVRRGDSLLEEVHLEIPSPFGLWLTRARRQTGCQLRVYPNLRDRATAALFLRIANPGVRLQRQLGKGREFERLREYVVGDSFEDMHWKATARRRSPIVKVYQLEHAQEVYAVVDCSRLTAREGILDKYVEAVLHVALAAERQGDKFGLITFSDRVHRLLRARQGMDHFRLCREVIYNLQAGRVSPDFRELFTGIQLNLRRRALLIFFTSLDDPLLGEIFAAEVGLIARRHVVLVHSMQTAGVRPQFSGEAPATPEAIYEGLAGQIVWNKTRALQLGLANRGVRLTIADPAHIKQQVAKAYLDVKRRQVL